MAAFRVSGLRALLAVIAVASISLSAPAQQTSPPHWTYEGEHGPLHWGSLDPAYRACEAGKAQSPIDIRGARAADLPAIAFSYRPSPLSILDNGHTIQVNYAPGSFITVGGEKYDLQQAHFHHPAEEKVNGRSYPLVAHLVHKNAEGKLAVIAVLFTSGQANAVVENLWKYLPSEENKEIAPGGVSVDLSGLLPLSRRYYTFTGSLTTPPCTEGVTWFVLETPVQVSENQIARFATKYPHNARPVQPLNGRVILMTK